MLAQAAGLQPAAPQSRAAGTGSTPAPIWDVEHLAELIGDDPAFLSELIAVFIETMTNQIQLLATAQPDAVTSIAHAIKGAAANFHAHRLAACANGIEAAARSGAVVPADLAALAATWRETQELVRRYAASMTARQAG
jgi:HPt (histidine-containing phosphotransfer) domain-containing protein